MKVLVFGSRAWTDRRAVEAFVDSLMPGTVVVSGMCPDSPDTWAADAARANGLFVVEVPVGEEHWAKHGRRAGPMRNGVMAGLGIDLAVGFSTGSRGTEDMAEKCWRRGIEVEMRT